MSQRANPRTCSHRSRPSITYIAFLVLSKMSFRMRITWLIKLHQNRKNLIKCSMKIKNNQKRKKKINSKNKTKFKKSR